MKVCLVSSGGGHLRLLLTLKQVLDRYDTYFVTERTSQSESLAESQSVYFVPDFALDTLKRSPRAWWSWFRNGLRSLRILLRERPDVIISSGAAIALNTLFLGGLFGAKIVFIQTPARTKHFSKTARSILSRADAVFVFWESLLERYPEAIHVPAIREGDEKLPDRKGGGTFVTVGTHGPFDRLLGEVDRLVESGKIPGPVIAQVGESGFTSPRVTTFVGCGSDEMRKRMEQADLVIAHAGAGSLFTALEVGARTLGVARNPDHGEHYDDHQLEILRELTSRGAILGAEDASQLEACIDRLSDFSPNRFEVLSDLLNEKVMALLEEWSREETKTTR